MTPISPLYLLQDMFYPTCFAYLDRFSPLPTCARGIFSQDQTPQALRICFREFADQLPKQFRFRITSSGSDRSDFWTRLQSATWLCSHSYHEIAFRTIEFDSRYS
jgi:hypothetical protein